MIEYKTMDALPMEAVKELYRQHGWLAYLQDDAKLASAFRQSLAVIGAFDGDRLAGFLRCVGDGEHIVLVQDLIVAKAYLRQGIGTKLMKMASERFAGVRMFMLVTDTLDERSNAFYQATGMRKLEETGCVSYVRL